MWSSEQITKLYYQNQRDPTANSPFQGHLVELAQEPTEVGDSVAVFLYCSRLGGLS